MNRITNEIVYKIRSIECIGRIKNILNKINIVYWIKIMD